MTLLIVVLGLGVFYLVNNKEIFTNLLSIPAHYIFGSLILRVLFQIVNGFMLREACILFDIRLSAEEWFGLTIISGFTNLFTPMTGGAFAKAAYLKKRHGLSYSHFASIFAATNVMLFISVAYCGAVVSVLIPDFPHASEVSIAMIGLAVGAATATFFAPRIPIKIQLVRHAREAVEGLRYLSCKKSMMVKFFLLGVTTLFLDTFSFFIIFQALGVSITLFNAAAFSCIVFFSIFIKITPGNLGIREVFATVSASLLGIGAENGLATALVFRACNLAIVLCLAPYFSYRFGFKNSQEKPENKN